MPFDAEPAGISGVKVNAGGRPLRFYAECAVCGGRRYAGGLWPRRGGDAGPGGAEWRRRLYERRLAAAGRRLTRRFNRCPVCGRWVCDGCFDLTDGCGRCAGCAEGSGG